MSWFESMSEGGKVMVVGLVAGACMCGTCNATLIAERWAGSDNAVRSACVQRCGNPTCKPCSLAEEKVRGDVAEARASALQVELDELRSALRMSRCMGAEKP